jgi:hypothetical protein
MNELIVKAVSIFRVSTDLDDDALLKRLVSDGVEHRLAARLVEFLPMAYARLMLEKSVARLPDSYLRMSTTGDLRTHPLDSEPVWNASIEYARAEVAKGISPQDLLAVAGRSAEIDAANKMLNAGFALKDCDISPSRLLWPEDA